MKKGRKKYELFEHTADIGLFIYGSDLEELFEAAAEALTAQVTDPRQVEPAVAKQVELSEESAEELLRSWMSEILFMFTSEKWLYARVDFKVLNEKELSALVYGEPLNDKKHEITGEVKAVTWHRLQIERLERQNVFRATVVLDV